MFRIALLFIFCFYLNALTAQKLDIQQLTENTMQAHAAKWGLTASDVAEYTITDHSYSKHSKVTHVYVNQMHNGIPVYNATNTLNYNLDGALIHSARRFVPDLAAKINAVSPQISPEEAISSFGKSHSLQIVSTDLIREKSDTDTDVIISKPEFAKNDIPVQLYYYIASERDVRLVWNMTVNMKQSNNYWSTMIDAVTGELVTERDIIVKCQFDHPHYLAAHDHIHCDHSALERPLVDIQHLSGGSVDGSSYLVYPPPLESPLYGDQQVVSEPALPAASPFGWHDLDGVAGADTTITRGNNTWTFADYDGDDEADGNEPDGGPDLQFMVPHNRADEPDPNLEADIINVFFMTNYMHDFSYVYGFDEQAGNFQENNYGNGGRGSDPVYAQSLDAYFDTEARNNANFVPFSDGSVSFMQMYAWEPGESVLTVASPSEIAGQLEVSAATWQMSRVTDELVSGRVEIVNDNVEVTNDACSDISNDLMGKIALIDRGRCEFGSKSLRAQEAGAIAALICNVVGVNGGDGDELVGMRAGDEGDLVTIPAVFMKKTDCDLIKATISNGNDVTINIQLPQEMEGARELSSGFDNGIIAHEYAHGISLRLTGGASNTNCLSNGEQMGEGWSDFFTLITSHREGDTREQGRGIGNYVQRGDQDSRGIRTFPYSTDMTVNPKTYNDIKSATSVHAVGEVWAVTLWDMYWNFIDLYGYDPDITNANSGNSRAIQLVMDGMKMQPCQPGYIDGRDAILAADRILFNGDHQCMIWETFARRGVGYFAEQGSSDSQGDNNENFEPLPTCIKELKISKDANEAITAGEEVTVTLNVANHLDDSRNEVVITYGIPEGMTYVDESIRCEACTNITATLDGDNLIIELGTLASLDEVEIEYELLSTGDLVTENVFIDDFESDDNLWIEVALEGSVFWSLNFEDFTSGERSWFIEATESEQDQALLNPDPILISGERPTIRFKHKYNTEAGFDGGFLEVSTDGNSWDIIPNEYFQANGYNSEIAFATFAIPGLSGFSGNSGGWIETFIDMSAYKGQELYVRFRFGTDAMEIAGGDFSGWFIDDFGMVDLASTSGEACITSAEGDMACDATAFIFNPSNESSDQWVVFQENNIKVFPNPTDHTLNIHFDTQQVGEGYVRLMTMDGQLVMNQSIRTTNNTNYQRIDVSDLPSGVYVMEIITQDYKVSDKVIKQ